MKQCTGTLNSQNLDAPLWVEEGIAGGLSTFEIRNGKGRWGQPKQDHVDYLNYKGLQPTKDFLLPLRTRHCIKLDTFYPQAWAMVHYFMFGNGGKTEKSLICFYLNWAKKAPRMPWNQPLE
jgi:hypothetical protein